MRVGSAGWQRGLAVRVGGISAGWQCGLAVRVGGISAGRGYQCGSGVSVRVGCISAGVRARGCRGAGVEARLGASVRGASESVWGMSECPGTVRGVRVYQKLSWEGPNRSQGDNSMSKETH